MRKRPSKSMFTPARGVVREEPPRDSGGYNSTRALLGRLAKRPLAIIPIVVIICIILFSILTPIFIDRDPAYMDPYYAKKGPRNARLAESIGLMQGDIVRREGRVGLFRLFGIGMGAEDKTGGGVSLFLAEGSEYMPVISYKEELDGYSVRLDSYLDVGFIYLTVTPEEYRRIEEYERETGIPILYPLIMENEYSPKREDPNVWYRVDSYGMPIDESGEVIEYSPDMKFTDNYMRDEDGEVIYSVYHGGGDLKGAGRRIRTLYYNYYLYKCGTRPDYLMGTDSQGYDLALRLAVGVRLSLLIATFVSLINLTIGAIVGSIEGYYGGVVDLALERVTDILSGVPFIVVATLFQIHLSLRVGAIPSLLFAFVLTGWLGTANRVRAQFYRYKNSEYVLAARTLGASDMRIMYKHIFPNALGTLITATALVIPGVIFSESMLSFLGIVNLGGGELTSLGTLLSEAGASFTNFPHLMFYPALFVSLLMVSFNILGNQLREVLI